MRRSVTICDRCKETQNAPNVSGWLHLEASAAIFAPAENATRGDLCPGCAGALTRFMHGAAVAKWP